MLVNEEWLEKWPGSVYISALPRTSDHSPLILAGHTITQTEAVMLSAPVTGTEIKNALFDIAEDSAPGPDGYTSAFFKAAWPIIGQEVIEAIGEFFRTGRLLKQAVQMERQAILDLMGFQEGSLPIKYLGVPLISSRLTIADCQPLIDKIDNRLAGWSQFNLSLAGRTQLIKSVLSSLHTYWASGFILPKSIINIIEGRMRKFLWQGSWRGYAKEDTQSIWVQWILRHRLHNQTIWTYSRSTSSWCWKKFVKLSTLMKAGVEYRIGDGHKLKLWTDLWHPRGPVLHSFSRGPSITGLPSDSLLMTVLQQGCWNWPSVIDFDIQEIISCLPNTFPQQSDSTAAAISLLQPPSPHVLGIAYWERSVRFQWLGLGWQRDLLWARKRWRGKHLLNAAARTLLASIVYNIWMERNSRRFSATASTAKLVASKAILETRLRIISEDIRPSLQLYVLYRLWKIPWDRDV
ncbi:UNVERIFIED_CONTAM: hypothetical protein Slati_0890900 [Sesamum latifolium]|uniref:Reverse transcriptase n=1 Tax=Sesamum latifolium TaxID=2727402 RepID=A0AAW2XN14_9LAMI